MQGPSAPRAPEGATGTSSEYSSSEEESSSDEEDGKDGGKDPSLGRVDDNKIPPVWDGVTARVLSEFEKMTLAIEPMDDDACWEDAAVQKEEGQAVAEAARGKLAKPESYRILGVAAAAQRSGAALAQERTDHRQGELRRDVHLVA